MDKYAVYVRKLISQSFNKSNQRKITSLDSGISRKILKMRANG